LTSWEIPFKDSPTTEDQTEEVLSMGEMVVPILAGMLSALRRFIARRVSLKVLKFIQLHYFLVSCWQMIAANHCSLNCLFPPGIM